MNKKLIVLVGPTAVGKTGLAIDLAMHWKTEIVSADSRQIYQEMAIGTAKPTNDQLSAVTHHFIDTHSIRDDYDAGQFSRDALALIGELFKRYDKVILCGGSGLYIRAVCEGFDDMPEVTAGTRERIMSKYKEKGIEWLQGEVKKNDPEYFAEVDQQNPQRLVRALELYDSTGRVMSQLRNNKRLSHVFEIIKVGLTIERELLYNRIDKRVDSMIEDGLVEEAKSLYPFKQTNALQTVGYAEFFGYFDGLYDLPEAIRLAKRNTRNYAKRQMTWFTRDKEVNWFRPDQMREIIQFCEMDNKPT